MTMIDSDRLRLDNILSTLYLDIDELLEDLRLHWEDNRDYRYNSSALTKTKRSGDNIMFCCPHHAEENPSCGILVSYPYSYNCFGCGATGSVGHLIAHVMGLASEEEGLQYILKHYMIASVAERPKLDIDSLIDGKELDKKRSVPEEEVLLYKGKWHPYMAKRGFGERTISTYEMGFDDERQAITLPVRTSGGQVRFIKRRFVNQKGFLNEKGIYKRDIVYGLYYIIQAPRRITEIYLNESETDVASCYQGRLPAGGLMGRILFKDQVRELQRADIKTANLFFDNDQAGVECTIQAGELLAKSGIRSNVVIYPEGHWGIDSIDQLNLKDANDLLLKGKLGNIKLVSYFDFMNLLKWRGED